MSSSTLPPITIGKEAYADRLADVIGEAFAAGGDLMNRASILSLDSLPNDAEIPPKRRSKYFLSGIRSKAVAGAHLVEAGDWAAVAVWMPPGVETEAPDLSTLSAPSRDYLEKFSQVKKRCLGEREYWYLHLIGRDPTRQEPGVVRALFKPYLLRAQEAGLPMWLEATNEHARDVYAHFGFEVVEKVIIGEGSIDENGNLVAGGKGIALYGMMLEPQK